MTGKLRKFVVAGATVSLLAIAPAATATTSPADRGASGDNDDAVLLVDVADLDIGLQDESDVSSDEAEEADVVIRLGEIFDGVF